MLSLRHVLILSGTYDTVCPVSRLSGLLLLKGTAADASLARYCILCLRARQKYMFSPYSSCLLELLESENRSPHLTALLADTCRACRADMASRAADLLQQSGRSSLHLWHLRYASCPARSVRIILWSAPISAAYPSYKTLVRQLGFLRISLGGLLYRRCGITAPPLLIYSVYDNIVAKDREGEPTAGR